MTHREKVKSFIDTGNQIASAKYVTNIGPAYVDKTKYVKWMGDIDIFIERHLKAHAMYQKINAHIFHYGKDNRLSHCNEMIGLLSSVFDDEEFWHDNAIANLPLADEPTHLTEGVESPKVTRGIFISHCTCDKDIADMLVDYLVNLGIQRECFFCSSLPGNDVQEKISEEVKRSIKNSALNIAILSDAYYESAYCLNEAGVLWYLDTPVIPIALPEIDHTKMIGFLDDNYKIRRLDNEDDLSFICDKAKSIFSVSASTASDMRRALKSITEKYRSVIDKRENAKAVSSKTENSFEISALSSPLEQVKELLKSPAEWIDEDSRYYHKQFPHFTVTIEYEEDECGIGKDGNREYYHYLQCDSRTQYGVLKVFYYGTQLYSCQVTALDGHRMIAPCPEWLFIEERMTNAPDICSKYYITSDFPYIILRFLECQIGENNGHEAQIATSRLLEAVLLFADKPEVDSFKRYVHNHRSVLDELAVKQRKPIVYAPSERVVEIESKRIRYSYALKELQKVWVKTVDK